jgi:carboxylate-amine ligase
MTQPALFRRNSWPTVGVEIELALADARSMALRSAIGSILPRIPAPLAGSVKPEFLQCYVEINSAVGRRVAEVGRDVAAKVRAVEEAAHEEGVRLLWCGTHPFSHWRDQQVTPDARYYGLAEELRETVLRPATFGLHVHVGVESGDAAVRVMNGIREHLPILLALSVNSPFWCGRETGLHSYRIDLLEGFPTGGLPPRLRGWEHYLALVEEMTRNGFIQSEKDLWWDVRPCRRGGTVEVRVCDMPPDLPSLLGLLALTQCLVFELERAQVRQTRDDECALLMVRQNRWRAARYGLSARLTDPLTGELVPARQLARVLVDRLRARADQLRCAEHLERVASMADAPTGAERQMEIRRRTGGLAEVVQAMCEASAATIDPDSGDGLRHDPHTLPRIGDGLRLVGPVESGSRGWVTLP